MIQTPISILITTFNCAPFIRHAIKSILNQSYKNFEFLIIDDGSTDNTEEIINSFEDERIKYSKIEHKGRAAALNYGLQLAVYDLIALMDADDIIHPQKIEKQLNLYRNRNDLIFTDSAFFKNDKILYELKIQNDLNIIKRKVALHGHLGPSVLFNRKFILEKGGFNPNLLAFEDYDLWLRILNDCNLIIVLEILYFQRLRKNSLSTTETMKKKHLIYEIQKPYFENLEKHFGITSPEERLIIKGWREFFYGSTNLARKYWFEAGLNKWSAKLLITFLLSYSPESFLDYLKDKRIRLRLEYQVQKIFKSDDIQKEFDKVLRLVIE